MLNKNPYTWVGTGLLIAGILVSPVAHFILALTWLTALGLCLLILSLILLALGGTIPKLPPEVCSLFLETGNDNMATIVEELGIRTRAVYLPSSLTGGQPQALLPLHSNSSLPVIKHALPRRLIVKYGNSPDEIGLLLSTIGSTAVSLFSPADPWVKVKPQKAALNRGKKIELNLSITPPLAGSSRPQLQTSATDTRGLIQINQSLEPVNLHVIPRAKYAE